VHKFIYHQDQLPSVYSYYFNKNRTSFLQHTHKRCSPFPVFQKFSWGKIYYIDSL